MMCLPTFKKWYDAQANDTQVFRNDGLGETEETVRNPGRKPGQN